MARSKDLRQDADVDPLKEFATGEISSLGVGVGSRRPDFITTPAMLPLSCRTVARSQRSTKRVSKRE